MTREIKFRARTVKTGEWIFFGLRDLNTPLDTPKVPKQFIPDAFIWDTVCQYTGLKDKNGKEIYEGDIVECDDKGNKSRYEVYFEVNEVYESRFGWNSCGWYKDEVEIIGNIYENPELLNNNKTMTIKEIIEKAIEGGWKNDVYPMLEATPNGIMPYIHIEAALLQPNFWKAVGKVEGWAEKTTIYENDKPLPVYKLVMHNMIDALCEGQSLEDFIKTL